MAKHIAVHKGKTEAEILALTSANPNDIYVSSDTGKTFTIGDSGEAFEDPNKEVVFVESEPEISDTPVSVFSESSGIHRIDARGSTSGGVEVGGTVGKHQYIFSGTKNTVDLSLPPVPATIEIGANATLVSPGLYEKDTTGNSWNSYIYSQESFDPNTQDFAVTVEIESTTGTIREMFGFDDNPTQNQSYSSIEYALYQVNNSFYSRVYEKGVQQLIPNYTTFYFQVGDKVGVKCIDGYITYFVLRNGVETEIYTSKTKATSPLFFKAAMNRGDGESGESQIGNVEFWVQTKPSQISRTVAGLSVDDISEEDADLLSEIGIAIEASSKYSDISFTRSTALKFDNSGTPYPLDMNHTFSSVAVQDIQTLTF